jgi:type III secretion system FlhB-like substrate exporter
MNEQVERKRVVGLKYEPGEGLPQVIVKGAGEMAETILRKRDPVNGPMIVKDAALVEQLYRLPMDAAIGPELFQLVAALLAHVFAVEQKLNEERQQWTR